MLRQDPGAARASAVTPPLRGSRHADRPSAAGADGRGGAELLVYGRSMLRRASRHSYVATPLRPGALVLDLGANHGAFARAVVARHGVRCVAVEASATLAAGLRERSPGLDVVHAAVGAHDGPVELAVSDVHEASALGGVLAGRHLRTETVPGVTLDGLLERAGADPVLVKVDVEGAELPMLEAASDAALRRIAQLAIEFHADEGAGRPEDVRRALERLRGLGFATVRCSRTDHDWLALRPEACGLGPLGLHALRHVHRNVAGARRLLRRRAGR